MTGNSEAANAENEGLPASVAPFVEAVTLQLSRAVEPEVATGSHNRLLDLTGRLSAVLDAVSRGMDDAAASMLAEEPLLLSSVFQNADLLYQHDVPFADRLGMVTLTAIHSAAEAPEASAPEAGKSTDSGPD